MITRFKSEVRAGFEPAMTVLQTGALPLGYRTILYCMRKSIIYADFSQAPRVGLEPTTPRLTAECSTIELSRNNV